MSKEGKLNLISSTSHSYWTREIMKLFPAEFKSNEKIKLRIKTILKNHYENAFKYVLKQRELEILNYTKDIYKVEFLTNFCSYNKSYHKTDIETIINTCQEVGFDIYKIKSSEYDTQRKTQPIADYHKAVFFLLHECGLTYETIGKIFGKHYSTVIVAVKEFHKFMKTDKQFISKFHFFVKALRAELKEKKIHTPLTVLLKSGVYDETLKQDIEERYIFANGKNI